MGEQARGSCVVCNAGLIHVETSVGFLEEEYLQNKFRGFLLVLTSLSRPVRLQQIVTPAAKIDKRRVATQLCQKDTNKGLSFERVSSVSCAKW